MTRKETRVKENGDAPRLVDSLKPERLVEAWETTPGQQLVVLIGEWNTTSTQVTRLREQANLKRLFARGSGRSTRREVQKEAQELEGKALPLLDELETITWRIVDVMAESPGARRSTNNWKIMIRPLQDMVKRGLSTREIDVTEEVEASREAEEKEE